MIVSQEQIIFNTPKEPGPPYDPYGSMQEFSMYDKASAIYNVGFAMPTIWDRFRAPEATQEEMQRDSLNGFDSVKLTEEYVNRNKPFWGEDPESRAKLYEARTFREFEHNLRYVNQLAEDRKIVEQMGFWSSIGYSLGLGLVDPPSWLLGGAAGMVYRGLATAPLAARAIAGAKVAGEIYAPTVKTLGRVASPKAGTYAPLAIPKAGETVIPYMHPQGLFFIGERGDVAEALARLPGPVTRNEAWRQATAAASFDATIQELYLQKNQPGREAEETLFNILGSAAFSGMIAGAPGLYRALVDPSREIAAVKSGYISPEAQRRALRSAEAWRNDPNTPDVPARDIELRTNGYSPEPIQDPVNGDLANPETIDQLYVKWQDDPDRFIKELIKHRKTYTRVDDKGGETRGRFSIFSALFPNQRLISSPIQAVRRLGFALSENNFAQTHLYPGRVREPAIETLVNADVNRYTHASIDILHRGFTRVNEAANKQFQSNMGRIRNNLWGDYGGKKAFVQEVWRYLTDKGYVPRREWQPYKDHIKATADEYVEKVIKPVEDMLVNTKRRNGQALIKDRSVPEGHRAHVHRVWDKTVIRRRTQELRQILYNHWVSKLEKTPTADELAQIRLDVEEFIEHVGGNQLAVDKQFLIEDIIDAEAKSLKQRAPIPSSMVRDFLVKDLDKITEIYLRDTMPAIHMTRKFGDSNLSEQLRIVTAEVELRKAKLVEMQKKAKEESTVQALTREIDALNKGQVQAQEAIQTIMRHMHHRAETDYDNWLTDTLKGLRTWTLMTNLGGMTVSALTDLPMIAMQVGARDAYGALFKGLVKGMFRPDSPWRMSKSEARELGIVIENVLNGRVRNIMLMEDLGGVSSRMDQIMHKSGTLFAKATGITYWTDTMKNIASYAIQRRLNRIIQAGGPATKKDTLWLKDMGVDASLLRDMKQKIAQHGAVVEGEQVLNIRNWHLNQDGTFDPAGAALADKTRYILLRGVDSAVPTPGAGDLPRFMRRHSGRVLTQFMTFPFTVHNRLVRPALQRFPDMPGTTLMNMAMLIATGSLVYMLKKYVKEGSEAFAKDEDLDSRILLLEGIQRSGLFDPFAGMIFQLDNATGNRMTKLLLGDAADKLTGGFRYRDPILEFGGPLFSNVSDAFKFTNGMIELLLDGKALSWGEASAGRRMIPLNNLVYLQRMGIMAQESLTGLEEPK